MPPFPYDTLRRPENLELLHSSLVTLHSSFTYDSASRLHKVIGQSITNTYAYAAKTPCDSRSTGLTIGT